MRYAISAFVAVCAMLPAAGGEWSQVRTRNYEVISEDSAERATEIAQRLELLDRMMRERVPALPADDDAVRTRILLLSRPDKVAEYYPVSAPGLPAFFSPAIDGPFMVADRARTRGEMSVTGEDALFNIFARNFARQFLRPSYPQWYAAGIAEYFSATEFSDDGLVQTGKAPLQILPYLAVKQRLSLRDVFTYEEDIDGIDYSSLMSAEAWQFLHFVDTIENGDKKLRDFVLRQKKGETVDDAFQAVFSETIDDADKAFTAYVKKDRITYHKIRFKDLKLAAATVEPLSRSDADLMLANMRLGIGLREKAPRSTRRDNMREDAQARIAEIAAARKDDGGRLLAARAALADGKVDDAEAALAPVLEATPDARDALILKARILLARAAATPERAAAIAKSARPAIVKANRLNPNDPVPLVLYYRSFAFEPDGPTAAATNGILRAVQLAPTTDAAIEATEELLRQGRKEEAVAMFRTISLEPDQEERRARINRLATRLIADHFPVEPGGKPMSLLKSTNRFPVPDYPAFSLQQGQDGVVRTRYCMDGNGKAVPRRIMILQSSGFPVIDFVTLKLFMEGKADKAFSPAENARGEKIESCAVVPFIYKIAF